MKTLLYILLLCAGPFLSAVEPEDFCARVEGEVGTAEWTESVVKRVLAGDQGAATELDNFLRPYLLNAFIGKLGDPVEAEELTQNTLIQVFMNLNRVDRYGGIRTWALTIGDFQRKGEYTKKSRRPQETLSPFQSRSEEGDIPTIAEPAARAAQTPPDTSTGPDFEAYWKRLNLPESGFDLYRMRMIQELEWPEIAEHLGRPVKELQRELATLNDRVERAREKMAALVKAVDALPSPQREVMAATEILGKGLAPVAMEMGLEISEVRELQAEGQSAVAPFLFSQKWNDHLMRFVPDGAREVAELIRNEGLSYREAADRLGLTQSAIATRQATARAAMDFARNELPKHIDILGKEVTKSIARLYWIQGRKPDEIAQIMGKSKSEVVVILSRARRRIRAQHHRNQVRAGGKISPFPAVLSERGVDSKLTEEEVAISYEKLEALQAKGFTEESLRDLISDFSDGDREIMELTLFDGMTPMEVQFETGVPNDRVRDRIARLTEKIERENPTAITPKRLRDWSGQQLAEAIGWKTKVTDPDSVPDVVENLVEQLPDGKPKTAADLVYRQGLSREEAAAQMKITHSVLNGHLKSARDQMANRNRDDAKVLAKQQAREAEELRRQNTVAGRARAVEKRQGAERRLRDAHWSTLPGEQSTALQESEVEGITLEEQAHRHGVSPGEMALRLSDARRASFAQLSGPRWDKNDIRFVAQASRELARLVLKEGWNVRDAASKLKIPFSEATTQVNAARDAIAFARTTLPERIAALSGDTNRRAAQLRFLDGYSSQEIAEILGRSKTTIEEALGNARLALRRNHQAPGATVEVPFPVALTEFEAGNYTKPLDLTPVVRKREKLDALTAQGWTEAQLREVLQDQRTEDQTLMELVLFEGLTPKEIEERTGIEKTKVANRSSKILKGIAEYNPKALAPAILRGDSGRALSETIGWGTKVTDPAEVPIVIRRMVDALSPALKPAAELVYIEGLSQDEAAVRLGIPPATLKTKLFQARAVMKNH